MPTVAHISISARTAAFSALIALLGAACGHEPTGLDFVPVTYVARTVNEVPIPAPLIQNPSYEYLVIADTLRFGLFGGAESTRASRVTVSGVASDVVVSHIDYSYHVRGDSLRLIYACPPDADCAPPPHGVFSADRRRLVVQQQLPAAVVEYERTSS